MPPTPGRHPQDLPPEQDPVFAPHQPPQPEHPASRGHDPNDPALTEYLQAHPNARLVHGTDGRVVAIEDAPPVDTRGRPLSGPPPPHGIPLVQGFRHVSGPGYDPTRQLPPLPPHAGFATPLDHFPEPPTSNTRAENHSPAVWPAEQQQQQQKHHRSHSNSSSHHNHHHSHGPPSVHGDLDSIQSERVDVLPPVHSTRGRRTSISSDAPSESRGHRHDLHDLTHPHGVAPPHPHIHVSPPEHGSSSPSLVSPTSSRTGGGGGGSRVHNHQRVGPGANINSERDPEYQRQLLRQRELEKERDREREREMAYRHQMSLEDPDLILHGGVSWVREEPGLIGPGVAHHDRSRSDTPGSASGNDPSRAPSTPSYERERDRERGSRSYAPRLSNILGLDQEPMYDPREDRAPGPRHLSTDNLAAGSASGILEPTRKRSRHDMEVDDDRGSEVLPLARGAVTSREIAGSGVGAAEEGLMIGVDNRGSKRAHHQDDRDSTTSGRGSVGRDEKAMDQDD